MLPHPTSWFDAWVAAAYGPEGFWTTSSPAAHFRTAAGLGPELAEAVLAVLDRSPRLGAVVDVGAGDGTLLAALHARRPSLTLAGVDLRPRPAGLPAAVGWHTDRWDVATGRWVGGLDGLLHGLGPALVLAIEWLDDLPCRLAARTSTGWSELDADRTPGDPLGPDDRRWCAAWWPAGHPVEVGRTRDAAWTALVVGAGRHGGSALMVDYGHTHATRPVRGSLAAYRAGRSVPAVPATDRNLTAHVAVDAVRSAAEQAGARTLLDSRQADALADLLGPTPDPADDPLQTLAARSRRRALASSAGWGGHRWLWQEHRGAL